jgi:hypothetical protein
LAHITTLGWDLKHPEKSWAPWLKPVILTTKEAEIGRIKVRSQPGQTVCETLSQKKPTQKGLGVWIKV